MFSVSVDNLWYKSKAISFFRVASSNSFVTLESSPVSKVNNMPVYKDEERGTWYVRCYYEDFTGKKKQIKKRGFKLQREAKECEADFLRKQKGSMDMTLRSMYEIYIEDMGHRCRQSTIDGKKHVFEKLILPYFENKPINKITTPKDIRAWQNHNHRLSRWFAHAL